MKAFAYISMLDVLLKLVVCFCIFISPVDKLIFYAVLLTIEAVIIRIIYSFYCHRHFEETRNKLIFDKVIFRDMLSFSGWNFFNNANGILSIQGVNMLINVFFGVTVNAARGIAVQVENAVLQFVNNFTVAINPQITKSYATGDMERMYSLVCRGAKFSYFAMLLMALPIVCEAEKILNIWLTVVPEHTVIFVQLSLVLGVFDCVGASGYTACAATGKMKRYALILTPIGLLEFPLTWVFFLMGAPVVSTYYLYIFIKFLVLMARLFLLRDMVGLSPVVFIKIVFYPIVLTTLVAVLPSMLVIYFFPQSLWRLFVSVIVALSAVSFASLYVGMTVGERQIIMERVYKFLRKHKS